MNITEQKQILNPILDDIASLLFVCLWCIPCTASWVDGEGELQHGVPPILEGVVRQGLNARQTLKHLEMNG